MSCESGLCAETWNLYIDQATKSEEEFLKACNMEMDTLLLFATLFSAVLTAFVIESYQSLQVDTGAVTVQLLQQLLASTQSNGTKAESETNLSDQPFRPTSSAVRVNSYWFAALVVSVSTAFLTILAKQWLFSLSRGLASTQEMMGRQQQYRHDNLRAWGLAPLLAALPILLHVSLLLFLVGLVEFLWPINKTVAIVSASLTSATVFFYAVTHILSLIYPTCPYRTSVTTVILSSINAFFREVLADWWSIKTVVGIRLYMLLRSYIESLSEDGREAYYYTIDALGYPGRWRRKNKVWWSQKLTKVFTPQYWEDKYISNNAELIDARALASMVERSARLDTGSKLLVEELAHFRGLVSHRDVLLEAGAIGLMVRHLRSQYSGSLVGLIEKEKEAIRHLTGALVRIVTEAEEHDTRTSVHVSGIPLPLDPAIASDVLYGDNGIRSLTVSGLCTPDASVSDNGDLVFFSHLLRLHLVVSSDRWYWSPIQTSIDDFHTRLRDPSRTSNLKDEDLIALVNTTIYIAMRPIRVEGDTARAWTEDRPQAQNSVRALITLGELMLHNPLMGHAARRQICWGIWRCHKQIPETYIQFGSLIPRIAKTANLGEHLADFLSSLHDHCADIGPPLQLAVLVLMEGLLYAPREGAEADLEDQDKLFNTLTRDFPTFLYVLHQQLCKTWPDELPIFVRLFHRIVTISVFLLFPPEECSERVRVNREHLRHALFRLLEQVARGPAATIEPPRIKSASQTSRTPSMEEKKAVEVVDTEVEPRCGTGDDHDTYTLVLDELSAEKLARTGFVAVLRAASLQTYSEPVKTILTMIADMACTSSQESAGGGYLDGTILAYLRDSADGVEELIRQLLSDDKYMEEAQSAIRAIARPDQDIQYSRLLNPGYKLRKDRRGPQFDLEPFPILPHIFVPGQHPEKDPPRFYYGWPPNSDTLLDYAYSHKLSGTEPEITASDDDELYKSSSEEEGEDKDKKKKDGEDDGKGQEGMKHEAEANRSACSSGKQIGNRARDSLTVEELASPEEQVTGTQQDSQLGVAKQPRKGDDGLAMFAAIEDILINLGLARMLLELEKEKLAGTYQAAGVHGSRSRVDDVGVGKGAKQGRHPCDYLVRTVPHMHHEFGIIISM
ncbi:predicted protein [Postia placenta Mad-698-R]|uniref:DUF6535 domain-containing protein n=1 Tax=Postia placenta MAD-698-R-SB12 TaxID=670580 RepID=A0A1X6MXM4_9APHY|nr:hypothetical protein POSPLADRAFT_1047390 [Postia placenta MAD-698-R-SB12]EED85623.1 predicted protein [Postia placenta Mad-698-R]OSX61125.1 hypothetical protein POSPLADRAFT_1047390 [Postia placenta MAD-698-R-SB12]